ALIRVVEGTQAASATVEKIARAANDQAVSISQVTQGVDQISSVVQTNSATAEESAAASEELSGQAQMLKSLVSQFKLKSTGTTKAE
ncbi:MAG: methyl-accepting chemotaxis protein, partial [Oscillospiraceae bacterium]